MKKFLLLCFLFFTLKSFAQDFDNDQYFPSKEIPITKTDIKQARKFIYENLDDFNKGVKVNFRKKLNPVLDSLKRKKLSIKIETIYFTGEIKQEKNAMGNIQLQIGDRKKPYCFFTVRKTWNSMALIILFGDDTL